jgi:hypothetical protein
MSRGSSSHNFYHTVYRYKYYQVTSVYYPVSLAGTKTREKNETRRASSENHNIITV